MCVSKNHRSLEISANSRISSSTVQMYANYHKAVLLSGSLVWGEPANSGSNSSEQALPSLLAKFP